MAFLSFPARMSTAILLVTLTAGACSAAATQPAASPSPRAASPSPATGTAAPATASAAPGVAATPGQPAPSPSVAHPRGTPPERIPITPSPAPVTGEVPPELVAKARVMLAAEVGASAAAQATIVVGEQVTWPDGSLGCPQPGMMYEQMVTPGYRLVFDVAGTQYDYRLTANGVIVRCRPAARPTP